MDNQKTELPYATSTMETNVKEVFPIDMEPELFAAQDGAGWLNFPFNEYRFHDQQLDQWIHTVGAIIRDPAKLDEVQRKHLSAAELEQMKKYMADDMDDEDL